VAPSSYSVCLARSWFATHAQMRCCRTPCTRCPPALSPYRAPRQRHALFAEEMQIRLDRHRFMTDDASAHHASGKMGATYEDKMAAPRRAAWRLPDKPAQDTLGAHRPARACKDRKTSTHSGVGPTSAHLVAPGRDQPRCSTLWMDREVLGTI
jgi:hypothetical protein